MAFRLIAQSVSIQTDTTRSGYGRLPVKKWRDLATCKPCVLEIPDEKGRLQYKGIYYTDAPVGFRIEYDSMRVVRVIGHYKENPTGDWRNLCARGYCDKDGVWTYFSAKGRKLYNEIWKDGNFVRQVPEQKKAELWKAELTLDGEVIDYRSDSIRVEQFKQLRVVPYFKNRNTDSSAIRVTVSLYCGRFDSVLSTGTVSNFQRITPPVEFRRKGKRFTISQMGFLVINVLVGNEVFWRFPIQLMKETAPKKP
jgi:hypothetical protein